MDRLPLTPLTTVRRMPDRASYDRATIEAILDAGLVCHVGVMREGAPVVIPMAYARRGSEIVLHGAPASQLLKEGAARVPLSVTVTLLDGIVVARAAFHHALNYRSVVVVGHAREITDLEEKRKALEALVTHVLRGVETGARPPNAKEIASTKVLALPLVQASAKVRRGGPRDDEADASWPAWSGHVPLGLAVGTPVPAGSVWPVPQGLTPYRRGSSDGSMSPGSSVRSDDPEGQAAP